MRKLYALLAGLFIVLASKPIQAQTINPDQANFSVTIQSNNNVSFTNLSVLGNVQGERRAIWLFGDGSSMHTPPLGNAQHHYNNSGTYTVCLKIFRYFNNHDSVLTASICKTIVLESPTCGANFEFRDSIPANAPARHIVKFFAIPSHSQNRPVQEVCWNFGDGTPVVCITATSNTPPANLLQVQHTFTGPGPYNVCVRIKYYEGCVAEKCKVVQLHNLPPPDSCRANFERINLTASTNPLNATFKAIPWHNNNKKPVRICWQFGDGRDTCIQYPSTFNGPYTVPHHYNAPGLYQVCVKILYQGGCESYKCESIRISEPDACRADFEKLPLLSLNNPLHAGFRALPWHNNNKKPSKICWQFGDGTDTCINYPENYTGQYIVNHRYQHPGQYQVCVKITYYGGCESGKCKPVTIQELPVTCAVNLVELTQSTTGLTRGFAAIPVSNPYRRPERICWQFGDGTDTCIMLDPLLPIPNLTVTHTYPGPGVYQACVKIKYTGGCEARACREVVIRPAASICGGYMTDSVTGPRTFKFKGFSIHAPGDEVLSWLWSFGDGTSAGGQQASHSYTASGEYTVCLKIKTRMGCETVICKKIRVLGPNQQILILTPNPVVNELHAQFYSSHTETVNIKINNQYGITARTYTRNAVTGLNNWGFDLSTLTPGIYTFIIQSPNQLATAIFIKL